MARDRAEGGSAMRISMVVAAARNGVIGRDGALPWKLPDDQKFFRQLTRGHCIVIGRKTFDEIGRKPLPDRKNLVVSRSPHPPENGVEFFTDLPNALAFAQAQGFAECFIAGGENVYREGYAYADRVHLTRVDAEPDGDARFPAIDETIWQCVERVPHPADERHAHAFTFERWERRPGHERRALPTADAARASIDPRPAIVPRATAQPDALVRTISASGTIAAKAILASELVAEALSLRPYAPTAANALGRALMGSLLIAVGSASDDVDDANVESVQVQFRGDGPLGSLTAIADSRARVRGTVQRPDTDCAREDGSPNVAHAVGLGALNVVRHRPRWRSPYTGSVPIVSGEIAGDLTLYLTESEQTPSAMGLGVAFGPRMADVGACGFLVQALPGATDEDLAQVEENVASLPRLAQLLEQPLDAHALLDRLLFGLGTRERHTMNPRFFCPCTRERALRTLSLLEREEVEEMVRRGAGQEIVCEFCGRAYQIVADEMRPLLAAMAAR